jgi:hypothetical protein
MTDYVPVDDGNTIRSSGQKSLAPAPRSCTYRYRNEKFEIVWVSQVPKNDDDALEYCLTEHDRGSGATYVERQTGFGDAEYIMLPYEFKTDGLFIWMERL